MTYMQVLKMPLKTFWSYNRQIDRLRAEEEMRWLVILQASGAQKSSTVERVVKSLKTEMGRPLVIDVPFDESKFQQIKRKQKQG